MRTIIHIGPHKTGSSAIQKWLLENRQHLLNSGIYYPAHEIDENGVSSGNVWDIATISSEGSLVVKQAKVDAIYERARSFKCHTLLLSSEFFAKHLVTVHKHFPSATYVAYLRFELEVIESGYNQGVKRHGYTKKFTLPKRSFSRTLRNLEQAIKKIGKEKFHFRPYAPSLFEGGHIVSDLLSVVGCVTPSVSLSAKVERVNTSYSPQGLEFKRWFNQFELGELQFRLDSFLQDEGSRYNEKYSLLSESEYAKCKANMLAHLESFCTKYEVKNAKQFLQLCEASRQAKRVKQEISDKEFSKLLRAFIQYGDDNAALLYNWKKSLVAKDTIASEERLQLIISAIPISKRIGWFATRVTKQIGARLSLNG